MHQFPPGAGSAPTPRSSIQLSVERRNYPGLAPPIDANPRSPGDAQEMVGTPASLRRSGATGAIRLSQHGQTIPRNGARRFVPHPSSGTGLAGDLGVDLSGGAKSHGLPVFEDFSSAQSGIPLPDCCDSLSPV